MIGLALYGSSFKSFDLTGLPLANTLACIGDSITVSGDSFLVLGNKWWGWAMVVPETGETESDGKLMPSGVVAAGGGDDIADMRSEHLPTVLSANPRPGLCAILGGTNDLPACGTQEAIDARIANLRFMYRQLAAVDILPVSCSVPASNTQRANAISLNTAIEALAISLNIPFVDFFSVTDNGVDGWIEGLSDDGGHPNEAGAKVIGQEFRDTITPHLNAIPYTLVTEGDDDGSDILWHNGTMLDDGDVDNKPDGGETQTNLAWLTTNGTPSFALVSDPGIVSGKWWKISSSVSEYIRMRWAGGAVLVNVSEGQEILFGFICKVVNPSVDLDSAVVVFNAADTNQILFAANLNDLQEAVSPFAVYYKIIVPAGITQLRGRITLINGTGDIYVGQYTLRDLS